MGPPDNSDKDGDGYGDWYGEHGDGDSALLGMGAKDTCLFLRGDTGECTASDLGDEGQPVGAAA